MSDPPTIPSLLTRYRETEREYQRTLATYLEAKRNASNARRALTNALQNRPGDLGDVVVGNELLTFDYATGLVIATVEVMPAEEPRDDPQAPSDQPVAEGDEPHGRPE